MLFKKVETTVLDVMITYGCAAFLMYTIGGVAYNVGKRIGKEEANQGKAKKVTYERYYGTHKD